MEFTYDEVCDLHAALGTTISHIKTHCREEDYGMTGLARYKALYAKTDKVMSEREESLIRSESAE